MKKIKILDRNGCFVSMKWSYNPDENTKAKEKAYNRLKLLNIIGAFVYEVAPEVFWYRTESKGINCLPY